MLYLTKIIYELEKKQTVIHFALFCLRIMQIQDMINEDSGEENVQKSGIFSLGYVFPFPNCTRNRPYWHLPPSANQFLLETCCFHRYPVSNSILAIIVCYSSTLFTLQDNMGCSWRSVVLCVIYTYRRNCPDVELQCVRCT